MTFDEWWATLDTWEQNRRFKDDAKEAFEAGKMEVLHQPADDTALNNLLAEGQAREKVLRSALETLACLGNGCHHGNSTGNLIAIEALAQPTDDTALRAALANERQKCIDACMRVICDERCYIDVNDAVEAIRALGDE